MSGLLETAEAASGTITAFATIALAILTFILARATNGMARATSTAQVVASLETNPWSWIHLDLVVQNTGNAPAFGVSVHFDPPLPYFVEKQGEAVPFGEISILRPGHQLSCSVNDFKTVSEKVYKVRITWRKSPSAKRVQSISYTINLIALGELSRLGSGAPEVQIADQLKLLRNDWKEVARGRGARLKVDSYSHDDRERERERHLEMRRQATQQSQQERATEE